MHDAPQNALHHLIRGHLIHIQNHIRRLRIGRFPIGHQAADLSQGVLPLQKRSGCIVFQTLVDGFRPGAQIYHSYRMTCQALEGQQEQGADQ